MPIIEIMALVDEQPDLESLLGETAQAAASALGTDERYCWVTFRSLSPGTYYEGGCLRDVGDAHRASPIVRVAAYPGRSAEAKRRLLKALAETVGLGLGVSPSSVFIELRELARGHVFAGGKVL